MMDVMLSANLDDEAVVGHGEGEDVAAAAAHEGVHEAREDALRLPQDREHLTRVHVYP
jgi:hypothetical protein